MYKNKRLYDNTLFNNNNNNILNKKFKFNDFINLDESFNTKINLDESFNTKINLDETINDFFNSSNESKSIESNSINCTNESESINCTNESKISNMNESESINLSNDAINSNMNESNENDVKIQEKSIYENYLNKIVILLENIDSRIEKCEKNISNILDIHNNIIDENKKKKKYQDEILKSYTS